MSPLDTARHVLDLEIEGLHAVRDALDEQFVALVELLHNIKGRVVITGIGKSGHIGRKIAATLASTGTPASFVHASEASHGDLGMITQDDAVICLSNSGETVELSDVIHYCARFDIPLIALVRRQGSLLVETANIAVVLPEVPEASPTGAPTASSTMMLAYGDALAIALLNKRGFTKEDFGKFHPGGKLGQALLRVESLMHAAEELPLVAKDRPLSDVLLTMTSKHFGCAGVVDQNRLIGIITDGDLRRHMSSNLLEATAERIMSPDPVTVSPQALAGEALGIMNQKNITCLFVVDADSNPIGILHIHDLLRAGIR